MEGREFDGGERILVLDGVLTVASCEFFRLSRIQGLGKQIHLDLGHIVKNKAIAVNLVARLETILAVKG